MRLMPNAPKSTVLSSGMGDEENQEQTEAVIEENMQGNDCIISNK